MKKSNKVIYKGKPRLYINEKLLDTQDAWDNLDLIKSIHIKRLALEEAMEVMPVECLAQADRDYTDLEFELQEAWGFDQNAKMHKFWNRPRCTCPKMDNDDNYPSILTYRNTECPLHGNGK